MGWLREGRLDDGQRWSNAERVGGGAFRTPPTRAPALFTDLVGAQERSDGSIFGRGIGMAHETLREALCVAVLLLCQQAPHRFDAVRRVTGQCVVG